MVVGDIKKILYIDMDGVVADYSNIEHNNKFKDYKEIGFFKEMPEIKDACQSILALYEKFDVYFLSTAPWSSPVAWKEKREWIENVFGDEFEKRLILTHRKDLVIGDYLIDDRLANGSDKFKGELILFGSNKFPDWKTVVKYLL
jgi:5'-nucleotidase